MTVYAAVAKGSHHQTVADLLPQPEPPAPGRDASPKEHMTHRLKTSVGKTLYRLRKQTVEPVFGIIKEVLGFRRFLFTRAGESVAGMDVGVSELQPQTALHAQKPSGGGLKRNEPARGRQNARSSGAESRSRRLEYQTGGLKNRDVAVVVAASGAAHRFRPQNQFAKPDNLLGSCLRKNSQRARRPFGCLPYRPNSWTKRHLPN